MWCGKCLVRRIAFRCKCSSDASVDQIEARDMKGFDCCCGQPEQRVVYHYHKSPTCVNSPFADDGRRHSPVIAVSWGPL
jgi:hypothetical protein